MVVGLLHHYDICQKVYLPNSVQLPIDQVSVQLSRPSGVQLNSSSNLGLLRTPDVYPRCDASAAFSNDAAFPTLVYTWRRHPPCFTLLFPEGSFFLLVHLYPSLSACTLLDNTALTLSVEIGCWPCVHSFSAINHQIFEILGHCLWHCFFF